MNAESLKSDGYRPLPKGDLPKWVEDGPTIWQVTDGESVALVEPLLPDSWVYAIRNPDGTFDDDDIGPEINFTPTHARPYAHQPKPQASKTYRITVAIPKLAEAFKIDGLQGETLYCQTLVQATSFANAKGLSESIRQQLRNAIVSSVEEVLWPDEASSQ